MMTKSIDDESPEAWSRINKWHRNGPDQHPRFPTKDEPKMLGDLLKEDYKLAEAKMTSSYTRQGYKFKTAWGDDDVNNPTHYADQGAVECIDAIESMLSREEFIGFLRGNSFKYRWRFRSKSNAIKDLRKAQWYENKLLAIIEEEGTTNDS
jgi:hypothetical protein